MPLHGKVAIVTGASQGIGRACVERFVAEGAKVVMSDIADNEGQAVAKALSAAGHAVRYLHADVSERLDVHNLVAAATEAFGRVDIMVTCAATIERARFLEMDEATFDKTIRVNLKGTFLCAQAAARQMVRQLAEEAGEPGAIVTMSSVSDWFGLPDSSAYAASKGGVSQITKSMALALAPHGIRVNAVGPGTVEESLNAGPPPGDDDIRPTLSRTPLGRLGRPEEIAAVAVWLASDQASYITGQTVYADGGRMPLNLVMPAKN
ncbi:MAG: glucose 1-dehydrogenase [Alphaproteobacteria bacterium]|nr:glucose 1-dehydrogenase [Alphaproteobacteria bacterium]